MGVLKVSLNLSSLKKYSFSHSNIIQKYYATYREYHSQDTTNIKSSYFQRTPNKTESKKIYLVSKSTVKHERKDTERYVWTWRKNESWWIIRKFSDSWISMNFLEKFEEEIPTKIFSKPIRSIRRRRIFSIGISLEILHSRSLEQISPIYAFRENGVIWVL